MILRASIAVALVFLIFFCSRGESYVGG
eukprot:SAG22_NODE_13981_length_388_cov_1.373702_2_plen_27_part_01